MLQVPPLVDPVRNAAKPRTPPTIEGVLPVAPYPIVHRKEQEDRRGEHPPHPNRPESGETPKGPVAAHAAETRRPGDRTDDDAPTTPRDRPSLGIDEYA